MATPLNTIFSWFETGDYPTQEQFQASWSSFWHKDDQIPTSQITNLNELFNQTASAEALNSHITDPNAHTNYLALKDASNLSPENVNGWRVKLGVGDIPANVALVDMGQNQSVFNKDQITSLCMLLENYVSGDGKILSSKIEALGLTELITATQTSLSGFISNYQSYTYEKNDIIAIPDASGNYSLYIFKGGGKTVSSNYLPTGLTNITISMVQGLQAALDAKLDKPTMTANYAGRWSGTNFVNGVIYDNGTNVSIGAGANPTPASIFDVQGTGRVSLPAPRMTQAQRQVITLSSVAAGGLVYQTDGLAGYYLWDGTTWKTLGSNISNADLTNTSARTFTQNAAFTWDTLGNSYYWKGLIDKTTDFANFNKLLVLNPTTKEVGITSVGITQVTIPDSIPNQLTNNYTITVNSAMPNPAPSLPTYQQELQNFMSTLYTNQFTQIPDNEWQFYSIDGSALVQNTSVNGAIALRANNNAYSSNGTGTMLATARTGVLRLPPNKNWALMMSFNSGVHQGYSYFGFGFSRNSNNTFSTDFDGIEVINSSGVIGINSISGTNAISGSAGLYGVSANNVLFVKLGDFIHVILNHNGQQKIASFNANTSLGNYIPTIYHKKGDNGYGNNFGCLVSGITYYIQQSN